MQFIFRMRTEKSPPREEIVESSDSETEYGTSQATHTIWRKEPQEEVDDGEEFYAFDGFESDEQDLEFEESDFDTVRKNMRKPTQLFGLSTISEEELSRRAEDVQHDIDNDLDQDKSWQGSFLKVEVDSIKTLRAGSSHISILGGEDQEENKENIPPKRDSSNKAKRHEMIQLIMDHTSDDLLRSLSLIENSLTSSSIKRRSSDYEAIVDTSAPRQSQEQQVVNVVNLINYSKNQSVEIDLQRERIFITPSRKRKSYVKKAIRKLFHH